MLQKVKQSQFCGRNWRNVHFAIETENKPNLQRHPLDFRLNVCAQTGVAEWDLGAHSTGVLGPTFFLEKV